MSWQHALELLGLASVICCALVCIDGYRSGKRKALHDRLNSPFFRQVTDRYYRAGKLN